MAELHELAAELTKETTEIMRTHETAAKYLQVVIAVFGCAVAISHGLALAGKPLPYIHEIGIFCSVIVALASVWLLFIHVGPSQALATAHRAVEFAREREEEFLGSARDQQQELDELEEALSDKVDSVQRGTDLYVATQDMQTVAQSAIADSTKTEIDSIKLLLKVSLRSLVIACGFSNRDTWTLAVFKADPPAINGVVLRCVALERSTPCPLDLARTWSEGQGVVGVAYTNKRETPVADLHSDDWKLLSNDDGILSSPEDKLKYRSGVGIPILPNGGLGSRPWGVVMATSDKVGHFREARETGLHPVHAVRAIAYMVELVIRAKHSINVNYMKQGPG